jgi:hypothetical protein
MTYISKDTSSYIVYIKSEIFDLRRVPDLALTSCMMARVV